MTIHPRIAIFALPIAAVATLLAPATGRAQDAAPQASATLTDSRWQPWLGCWTPVERAPGNRDVHVCIVPTTDGAGARMMTFAGDQRILDETILADGSTQTLTEADCHGSSRSVWASNAARLFRATELTCDGKAPQRTTGISTMLVQEKKGVTLIPNAAVQRNAQNTFVYVVEPDESVTIRNVSIGTTDAERSEVVSGISPHQLIVIDGVDRLQAGSRVAVSWSQDEDTRKNDRNAAPVATSGRSGNGGGTKP